VDIAVRRDKEMQANAGMIKLPVAVINHGNTVKFTEYSFISNVFAMRGYLAFSIQHKSGIAKASIQGMLEKFLEDDSKLRPAETKVPEMTDPGPVAPYAPVRDRKWANTSAQRHPLQW
jgi:hypothetical protein